MRKGCLEKGWEVGILYPTDLKLATYQWVEKRVRRASWSWVGAFLGCNLNRESFNPPEAVNNGMRELLPLGKEAPKKRVNRQRGRNQLSRGRERLLRHTSGCLLGLFHPLTDFLSIGDLVASQYEWRMRAPLWKPCLGPKKNSFLMRLKTPPFLQWMKRFMNKNSPSMSSQLVIQLILSALITGLEYALPLPVVRKVADSRNNWNCSLHSSWRIYLFFGRWSSLSLVLLVMSASRLSDIQLLTCPRPFFQSKKPMPPFSGVIESAGTTEGINIGS